MYKLAVYNKNMNEGVKDNVVYSRRQLTFLATYCNVINLLALVGAAVTLYILPYGAVSFGNRYEADINTLITIGCIAGMVVFLATSIIVFLPPTKKRKATDQETKSFERFVPRQLLMFAAMILLIWFMTIPWVFAHLGNDGPWLIALLVVPLMIALGLLFGMLAWLFVTVPLNMVVRGAYAALRNRDVAGLGMVATGGMLLALGSLIVIIPMAVDLNHGGPAGWPAVLAAMVGLPGGYTIENEGALVVGRVISAVALMLIVIFLVMRHRINKTHKKR